MKALPMLSASLHTIRGLVGGLIASLTFLVFFGALDHGVVSWDDNLYLNSPLIRSLNADHLWRMLTAVEPFYWHPLTWMSHALDRFLFGSDPFGSHLTNLVLHTCNTVWVFVLFQVWIPIVFPQVSRNRMLIAAAWAALAFGLHPLRVESAVWVAERKDLLCAFFMFAALAVYPKTILSTGARRMWSGLTFLFGLLAIMSKPMAVTLPVLLLLLDGWPLRRFQRFPEFFSCLLEKWPYFFLSLASGLIALTSQQSDGAMVGVGVLTWWDRILNASTSVFFYLEKTLWPVALVPLYPFPSDISLADPRYLAALTGLVVISIWGIVEWRRGRRAWLTLWLWYLVAVAPVIGLVQVGRQGAADRFAYLPTLVVYLAAGAGLLMLLDRFGQGEKPGLQRVVLIGAWILVACLGVTTQKQVEVWRNDETLWRRVVDVYPVRFAVAWEKLGMAAFEKGKLKEARSLLQTALKIDPHAYLVRNNLGLVLLGLGDDEAALKEFERALQRDPGPSSFNNIGLVYFNREELAPARHYFEKARLRDPVFPQALNNLGLIHKLKKEWKQAEKLFLQAVAADEMFWEAHANLGVVYFSQERIPEAVQSLSTALDINPRHEGLRNLFFQVRRVLERGGNSSAGANQGIVRKESERR